MQNLVKVEAQLVFQLVAFHSRFNRSIPVVATDCATAIRVWTLDESESSLFEYRGPSGAP